MVLELEQACGVRGPGSSMGQKESIRAVWIKKDSSLPTCLMLNLPPYIPSLQQASRKCRTDKSAELSWP